MHWSCTPETCRLCTWPARPSHCVDTCPSLPSFWAGTTHSRCYVLYPVQYCPLHRTQPRTQPRSHGRPDSAKRCCPGCRPGPFPEGWHPEAYQYHNAHCCRAVLLLQDEDNTMLHPTAPPSGGDLRKARTRMACSVLPVLWGPQPATRMGATHKTRAITTSQAGTLTQ